MTREKASVLALLTLVCIVGASAVTAETIQVGTVGEAECTLFDAILAANTDSQQGGCPAGSGDDTLVLEEGRIYELDSPYKGPGEDEGYPYGLPKVTSNVTMTGNGATIRRNESAPVFGLLTSVYGGELTLEGLTFENGMATAEAGGCGGAVSYMRGPKLTVRGCTFRGNGFHGGDDKGNGGAICVVGEDPGKAALALDDSSFFANAAQGGGAIHLHHATASISTSVFEGNRAQYGGAIYAEWSDATIESSRFVGNTFDDEQYATGSLDGRSSSIHLVFP